MRKIPHLVVLAGLVLVAVSACAADGPPASPEGKLFALEAPHNAFAAPELSAVYEKTGATAAMLNAVWAEIQPVGAAKPDFSSFDNQPLAKSAKTRIVRIDLATSDKTRSGDPKRYWELADAFITELVKHANGMGIKHFAYEIRQEQPESSVGPTAKSIEPLKHIYSAVKAVSNQNTVIAEQPYGSGANAVQILYRTGAKGSFDVPMVHAVAKAGGPVDPFALVAAHREMANNNDANKKLLVIGGWEVSTALGEIPWHAVSADIESDLRSILTERDIYDPEWVLGEVFSLPERPSADFVAALPPKLPEARLEAQLTADGPIFNYVIEMPYKLALTLTNLGKDEMKLGKFTIALRGDAEMAVESKPQGETPASVPAGGSATANFIVTLPKDAAGKQVTLVSSVDYTIGDRGHVADSWLTLMATPQYEITLLPSRLILDPREGAKRVGMSVINHTDAVFDGRITLSAHKGITVSPMEFATKIDQFGLEAFVYNVSADKDAAPGHYAVFVDVGGKVKDWQAVDVALVAKKSAAQFALDIKPDDLRDGVRINKAGRAWFAYNESALYVAVEVEAAKHVKALAEDVLARGDSLLIGIDPLMNGASASAGGYKEDDYEFAVADTANGPMIVGTHKSTVKRTGLTAARLVGFRSEGGKSVFQVAIPWEEIAPLKAAKGTTFGIDLLVNSGEDAERSVIEWGGGLTGRKDPRRFVPLVLAE